MPREMVPELHDILKLTTLKHNFDDFGPYQSNAPDAPTWLGVLQHHCSDDFPSYPTDRDTFLLHVADGLAAQSARHAQKSQRGTAWTVHRVWNPDAVAKDERLSTAQDIVQMLQFLATDPTFDEVYRRYQRIFETRAEDSKPGKNVTTLETHVRLVGCFYRFLRRSKVFEVTQKEVEDAVNKVLVRRPPSLCQ